MTLRVAGYREQAVTRTKEGRSLLESHRDRDQGDRQTIYDGAKRERELALALKRTGREDGAAREMALFERARREAAEEQRRAMAAAGDGRGGLSGRRTHGTPRRGEPIQTTDG